MLTGSHDTPSLAWKSILFLVTSLLFISCVSFKPAHTLPPTTTYLKKSFSSPNYTLPYRILYPKGYDGTTKYPLVFFLHGSGERGTDNEKQLIHGAQLFLDSIDKYPSIVIFPQCNHSDYWANIEPTQLSLPDDTIILFQKIEQPGPSATALNLLVDSFLNEPTTDLARIYILRAYLWVVWAPHKYWQRAQILLRRLLLFAAQRRWIMCSSFAKLPHNCFKECRTTLYSLSIANCITMP